MQTELRKTRDVLSSTSHRVNGLTEKETITFRFNDQGWTHGVRTGEDASMYAATHSGMQLGNFLSQPVKIADVTWNGAGLSITELNPWDGFLKSPTVARKIANYKLLRGKLNVKFVLSGSPFLYGKTMCVYHPLYGVDDFAPENDDGRICRLSQRQHVYMNPTTSSGGVLELPFFWQYNAVHIPLEEWDKLGIITMLPISVLKHAAGETPSCKVTVFAWMSDIELSQPTSSAVSYVGQMGEAEGKVVSKTATAIGKVAGALSAAPVIGPYARATEQVATKFGRLADIFGFSKPRGTHDISHARTRHVGSMATVNDKDTARTLTLDAKNEVTIDPRTVGLSPEDEMTIPYIASKEALITRFTWDISDDPDQVLLSIPVTPYVGATFPTDGKIDMPPCAYMASFFKYWKGTMQYRFIINASNFHRGKLRFRYEPYAVSPGQDYNVVQSEIVDLAEMHDHKIEVGWGSDRNYLQVVDGIISPTRPNRNTNLLTHNGTLIVSVANNLTVPDETSETSIEILMAVSTGKDIQFSVPDDRIMRRWQIVADVTGTSDPVPDDPDDPETPQGTLVYPQPNKILSTEAGVFYYGWHSSNFHNNERYLRDELIPRQYPEVPGIPADEYEDTDRTVVRAQFDTMLRAGITYCVCSWGGLGSRTDNQFENAVMNEAGAVPLGTMKVALLYEMNKLRNIAGGNRIFNQQVEDAIITDISHAKTNGYLNSSKYLTKDLKDGSQTNCPVIFLYLLRGYSDNDKVLIMQTIINTCQDSSIGGFSTYPYIIGDLMFGSPRSFGGSVTSRLGALGAYDVGGQVKDGDNQITDSVIRNLHTTFRQWKNLNPSIDMIPTLSPGYNDQAVRSGKKVLPRDLQGYDKGSTFKSMLANMEGLSITTSGQAFIINSWNEWHEDSQIEPCGGGADTNVPEELTRGYTYEAYGTKYVNIVGDYMVSGYVAQSEERENEHAPEAEPEHILLEKQGVYAEDDSIFFGERVGSIRAMLKRYTKYMVNDTTNDIKGSLAFPNVPYFKWDAPSADLEETLINRLSVLYLARRGATRWKSLPDFRNGNPRIQSVALTPRGQFQRTDNLVAEDMVPYGWTGVDVVTGNYDPVLEWEAPYYSNKRFQIARSLERTDDSGHVHFYDGDNVMRIHYMCAAADDYQLFYFLGTPSVSFS